MWLEIVVKINTFRKLRYYDKLQKVLGVNVDARYLHNTFDH
jgi:hypothetical protein